MKPSQVAKAISYVTFEKRRPIFLWGAPGGGKTDVVGQVAAEHGRKVIDFRLAMRDPTDIKGFPMPDHESGLMRFMRDEELPRPGMGPGLLFMDEMNSATPATQACAMQLTLTGQIGSYRLPDDWDVMAAGNRETDRSVVPRMPSALASRFVHVDYEVDVDDWCVWAFKHGISANTIAFIRFRRDMLSKFDPKERAYPVPRTWMFADEIVTDTKVDHEIEYDLLKGTVGAGAAGEYIAYVKTIQHMPSLDKILIDPDGQEVPTKPDVMFAVATGLAIRAEKNNFDRVMKYMNRSPVEFQVTFVKDCVRKDDRVCETKSFQEWVTVNSDVMV